MTKPPTPKVDPVVIERAGARAALAVVTLSVQMHRSLCRICKHGGPGCDDLRRLVVKRDQLRERAA